MLDPVVIETHVQPHGGRKVGLCGILAPNARKTAQKMVEFSGSFTQSIDERLRIGLPKELMDTLLAMTGSTKDDSIDIVVTVTKRKRLGVYTKKRFHEIKEEYRKRKEFDVAAEALYTAMCNFADPQVLDKSGRFRIPQAMAIALQLEKGDAFMVGSGECIEVMNKEHYVAQMMKAMEEMQGHQQAMMETRRKAMEIAE